jgi:Flp pilus assembly CpaF family ATPase
VNVITVEDPVEYDLPGVAQIQVNEKAGLTFASALRSILRQDPDIVMVGEMRDFETAHIGVQASLTGHLVLSTLHTNDSTSAVTRLTDMASSPIWSRDRSSAWWPSALCGASVPSAVRRLPCRPCLPGEGSKGPGGARM